MTHLLSSSLTRLCSFGWSPVSAGSPPAPNERELMLDRQSTRSHRSTRCCNKPNRRLQFGQAGSRLFREVTILRTRRATSQDGGSPTDVPSLADSWSLDKSSARYQLLYESGGARKNKRPLAYCRVCKHQLQSRWTRPTNFARIWRVRAARQNGRGHHHSS